MTELPPSPTTCELFCAELGQRFTAEFALLLALDAQRQQLNLLCGMHLATDQPLPPRLINADQLPRFVSALLKERALRLDRGGGQPDRSNLADLLGAQSIRYALLVPVLEAAVGGNIAVLLVRSSAAWQAGDIAEVTYAMNEFGVSRLDLGAGQQPQLKRERITTGTLLGLDRIFSDGENGEPLVEDPHQQPFTPAFTASETEQDEEEAEDLSSEYSLPEPGGTYQLPSSESTFADFDADEDPLVLQLQQENEQYRQDLERLLVYVDNLKTQHPEQPNGRSSELVSELKRENDELRQTLEQLGRSQPATSNLPGVDVQQAKEELRLVLEEVARLHLQLETAQQALLDVEAGEAPSSDGKIPQEKAEVIASIAQELRQPLSSVLGYTDLLLGESVGILGALQRGFLERVRSSTDRMNTLIEDLIHIAELDQAGVELVRMPVDLSAVIDDAVNLVREQLQEKRILLRLDLPRQLPELHTDRDALQQIIFHLLQNADAATPAEGEITLRAFVEEEAELGEFVLVQVSDSGGGIPEEDLPRVFSRIYRAQNPIIEGVGDTGVGLTIAETLTQALGGRIWVESEEGLGARFSVLLPLSV